MDTETTGKERRRKRAKKTGEENEDWKKSKMDRNLMGFEIESRMPQSFERSFRLLEGEIEDRTEENFPEGNPGEEELNVFSIGSRHAGENDSESSHLTYDVIKDTREETSISGDGEQSRPPVPAPRRKQVVSTSEKVSSDTDRDVAEIDLDEIRHGKSDAESKFGKPETSDSNRSVPVPKPRKLIPRTVSDVSRNSTVDSEEAVSAADTEKSKPEVSESTELPITKTLSHDYRFKSEKEVGKILKKSKKLRIADLIGRKRRKKKSPPSLSPSGKHKFPRITSVLKDIEEERVEEEEEESGDFQTDPYRPQETKQNGKIYVQGKNGFHVAERKDLLKFGDSKENGSENERRMEDSTVKTAITVQKYWSRGMIYFHGVLAGFALGHATFVTAIILHFKYDPKRFIEIYSNPSLKIHFTFYALTTFCIVSCFDRIDIGHINMKHWKIAWKTPSVWAVFSIYLISFGLTFANQKTETRFDSCQYLQGNETEKIWDKGSNEMQISLLNWFHIIWIRDALLMVAWLLLSLTKFSDLLSGHLENMVKYAEVTN